jgi:ribonuclease Z
LTIEQIKDAKDGLDILLDGKTIPNEELTSPPEPSKKYAYCSDTCYYEKIVPDIMDADLVYHEATFLQEHKERAKTTMHSTAKDAARIALKANVKKLILGHFSIRYKDLELFKSEAQQIFIETYLAEEGKHFKI